MDHELATHAHSAVIECGNVTLHRLERLATIDDERLHLTPKEFAPA